MYTHTQTKVHQIYINVVECFTISLHHAVKERQDTWGNLVVKGHGFGQCFHGKPYDIVSVTM